MHISSLGSLRQVGLRLPSLFTIGPYRVYFWSNELGEPVHVHVCKGIPSPSATKLWITEGGGCVLASNGSKIPERELNLLMECIAAQSSFICEKWCEFFHTSGIHFYC